MGSHLRFDNGLLEITLQTGTNSYKEYSIPVSEIRTFNYKRPGLFAKGSLQFYLKNGKKTEKLQVEKKFASAFDQLVSSLNDEIAPQKSIVNKVSEAYRSNLMDFSTIKSIMSSNEFVAVDIEWADSSDPSSVCEIGFAKFIGNELVDTFHSYIRPKNKFILGKREFQIHGIQESLILQSQTLAEKWDEISEFIAGNPWVLHNATQDINRILSSLGEKSVSNFLYYDTLLIAKKIPWVKSKNTLSDLSIYFDIEKGWANYDQREVVNDRPHGAVEDSIVTGKILLEMMNTVSYSNIHNFFQLVGTTPGQVIENKVAIGASAPGQLLWTSHDEVPSEREFAQQIEKKESQQEKYVEKKRSAEQVKNDFLSQAPIPWSQMVVKTGNKVYFSTFPEQAEYLIMKEANAIGLITDQFNAKIDLLVVNDDAVRDSAKIRTAVNYSQPVAVTNYTNFIKNNPSFPPKNW